MQVWECIASLSYRVCVGYTIRQKSCRENAPLLMLCMLGDVNTVPYPLSFLWSSIKSHSSSVRGYSDRIFLLLLLPR